MHQSRITRLCASFLFDDELRNENVFKRFELQVGSIEKNILPDAKTLGDELPDVVNDLDWDYEPDEQTDVGRVSENKSKLEEKVSAREQRFDFLLSFPPSVACVFGKRCRLADLPCSYMQGVCVCDEILLDAVCLLSDKCSFALANAERSQVGLVREGCGTCSHACTRTQIDLLSCRSNRLMYGSSLSRGQGRNC